MFNWICSKAGNTTLKWYYERAKERIASLEKELLRMQDYKDKEHLPCGHHKSNLVDDQCGRADHKYCELCNILENYNDTDVLFSEAQDIISDLQKRLLAYKEADRES